MWLEIELAQDITAALIRRAVDEQRPIDWEAEVLLCRALGLPHSRGAPNDQGGALTMSQADA